MALCERWGPAGSLMCDMQCEVEHSVGWKAAARTTFSKLNTSSALRGSACTASDRLLCPADVDLDATRSERPATPAVKTGAALSGRFVLFAAAAQTVLRAELLLDVLCVLLGFESSDTDRRAAHAAESIAIIADFSMSDCESQRLLTPSTRV